jgi:hypothetical protein
MANKICDIEGNWLTHLVVDKQQLWNVDSYKVTRPIAQTVSNTGVEVLPSDWRYREDLIWLKYGFMNIAASWKVKLEVQQRKDRKERQDAEAERKKNTKK